MKFTDMFYGRSNRDVDDKLFIACQNGLPELFEQALQEGADPNACDVATRRRPIHVAVVSGNTEIIERLLAIPGVETDVADARWWTPLEIAHYKGYDEAIVLLEPTSGQQEGKDGDPPRPVGGSLSPRGNQVRRVHGL